MRSRYKVHETGKAHFVTGTIVEWLTVFTSSACCDILVNSLAYCRQHKGLKVFGWVILDNHFHAILQASDLSGVLRDIKSFTAFRIIEHLQLERREWLLKLDYLHNNLVKRGWVVAPEHWKYSSAHEYLKASQPAFRCDAWIA